MAPIPELNQPLSVSQITGHIQHVLESDFASVWVKGEISNLTRHSSGHWYFSLKDRGAQLGAVMFRRQNQTVRFEIGHGMEITAHGRISVYPPQGRYQLIIDQILPAGQGDLHLAFEALKKKLQVEGLFDSSRKRVLPRYPEKIGIVTSPTGAAIRDILNILSRRFPLAELLLLPVRVQGEGAAIEIANAIKTLNERADCQVMIVGRGGGSLEDLWAFNEEIVARAIAASAIPIVTGVGHETDTTISDFVADQRAPTPSAAAEIVVPDGQKLEQRLSDMGQKLHQNILHRVTTLYQRLDVYQNSYALKRPALMIDQSIQQLDQLQDRSLRATSERLKLLHSQLDGLASKIQVLNPLSILDRGYAVLSQPGGVILKSVKNSQPDDKIQARLSDGNLALSVDSIEIEE